MANLNAWQKISRVLNGQPFGDGVNGSATVASDPNTRATITGTATQTTGTAGSTAFANGDLVMLYQTQGTGATQWEINRVASGGGTTSLVFQVAHNYTYGTGAQIIKIPRYTTAILNAHSATSWDGTTGGIEVICAKRSITISEALTCVGVAGSSLAYNYGNGTKAGGVGGGFRGGQSKYEGGGNFWAWKGEGTVGASAQASDNTANGNGGGAGGAGYTGEVRGGGAGGNAVAGGIGWGGDAQSGRGGLQVGSADLTTMALGGGGGGYARSNAGQDGTASGSSGGGIFILISKEIIVNSTLKVNGGDGFNITSGAGYGGDCTNDGAGGAGGSVLLVCKTATLGTANITATGGSPVNSGVSASTGSIAVHHSDTITGTTSPTFTDVSDLSLKELIYSGMV